MADVVVLLGAGASKNAGLPLVKELVSSFREVVDGNDKTWVDRIYARLSAHEESPDVERLLETLEQLERRESQILTSFVTSTGWDKGATGTAGDYESVRKRLYAHIRQQLALTPEKTAYLDPLIDLARLYGGLDIFSLNYDLAIETACARLGVPYTDGFDPLWNPQQFGDGRFVVRLHKLHGSLMWYQLPDGTIEKIQVAPETSGELRHFAGHDLTPALIYPAAAGKDVHVDPYATLVERFRAALSDARLLVCIGYSFRDPHIKSVVLAKMRTNPGLHLFVIDPSTAAVLNGSDDLLSQHGTFAAHKARIIPWAAPAKDALRDHGLRDRVKLARDVATLIDSADARRRDATRGRIKFRRRCGTRQRSRCPSNGVGPSPRPYRQTRATTIGQSRAG